MTASRASRDTVNMSRLGVVVPRLASIWRRMSPPPGLRATGDQRAPRKSRHRSIRWRRHRFSVGGPFALVLAMASAGVALGGQGDLDPTFGTGGVARIPLGAQEVDSVGGLALQPDGKLVIATTADSVAMVVRLTQSGVLDPTFANGGKVSSTDPSAVGVVVDDSVIRVAGRGNGVGLFVRSYDELGTLGVRLEITAPLGRPGSSFSGRWSGVGPWEVECTPPRSTTLRRGVRERCYRRGLGKRRHPFNLRRAARIGFALVPSWRGSCWRRRGIPPESCGRSR